MFIEVIYKTQSRINPILSFENFPWFHRTWETTKTKTIELNCIRRILGPNEAWRAILNFQLANVARLRRISSRSAEGEHHGKRRPLLWRKRRYLYVDVCRYTISYENFYYYEVWRQYAAWYGHWFQYI